MSKASYKYRAIQASGGQTKGVIAAGSQQEAYRKLVAAGLKPLTISGGRGMGGRGKRITLKELSQFTYQFSILMSAKIPIVEGLRSIVEQEQNERLRAVVDDVATQVEGGCSVTDALGPHRETFGEIYVETVRAAEVSGNMIEVLGNLSNMMAAQYEMRKTIKSALLYPICVIVSLALAMTFLMIFVVPKFATLFAKRNVPLPMPTQVVIAVSDFMQSYWYLLLAGIIAAVFGVKKLWRIPKARSRIDTMLHRVPFLQDLLRGAAISRFASVVGLSIRSGLSLIDALDMGGRASGRPLLLHDAEKLRDQVNLGGRLSDVVVACDYFPTFTRRMIAAGEEAAELPRMCEVIAQDCDRDVQHLTKNITTLIEPIMIAGLAGIVLVIALAIFLPMWNMAALLG